MKLPIRYFSIGILTSTLIVAVTLYFFDNTPNGLEDESVDSIIAFLEDDDYRVISEDEYISLSVGNSTNDQENEEESNESESNKPRDETNENDAEESSDENEDSNEESNNEPDEDGDSNDGSNEENDDDQSESEDKETNEESAVTYTLEVEPNMLSPEVSQLLVDNEIIDDAEAFTTYLEDEDYSKYIQLGNHEVSNKMSFNELAEVITSN